MHSGQVTGSPRQMRPPRRFPRGSRGGAASCSSTLSAARARQEAYLLRQFSALGAADQTALLAAVAPLEKLLAVKA